MAAELSFANLSLKFICFSCGPPCRQLGSMRTFYRTWLSRLTLQVGRFLTSESSSFSFSLLPELDICHSSRYLDLVLTAEPAFVINDSNCVHIAVACLVSSSQFLGSHFRENWSGCHRNRSLRSQSQLYLPEARRTSSRSCSHPVSPPSFSFSNLHVSSSHMQTSSGSCGNVISGGAVGDMELSTSDLHM